MNAAAFVLAVGVPIFNYLIGIAASLFAACRFHNPLFPFPSYSGSWRPFPPPKTYLLTLGPSLKIMANSEIIQGLLMGLLDSSGCTMRGYMREVGGH